MAVMSAVTWKACLCNMTDISLSHGRHVSVTWEPCLLRHGISVTWQACLCHMAGMCAVTWWASLSHMGAMSVLHRRHLFVTCHTCPCHMPGMYPSFKIPMCALKVICLQECPTNGHQLPMTRLFVIIGTAKNIICHGKM